MLHFSVSNFTKFSRKLAMPNNFYTAEICPFAHRAHIALKELKVLDQVTVHNIDLANKPDWFVKVSPELKVPVLEIEGKNIRESLLATEYLIEVYGTNSSLLPTDPYERYEMRLFIEEYSNCVIPAFYQLLLAKNSEDAETYTEKLCNAIKKMDSKIKGPYILGEKFTMADIICIPWPIRFSALEENRGFKIPQQPEYERFQNWISICLNRESIKETSLDQSRYATMYKDYIAAKTNK